MTHSGPTLPLRRGGGGGDTQLTLPKIRFLYWMRTDTRYHSLGLGGPTDV